MSHIYDKYCVDEIICIKIYKKNDINENILLKKIKNKSFDNMLDIIDSYYINYNKNNKIYNKKQNNEIMNEKRENELRLELPMDINSTSCDVDNIRINKRYYKYYNLGKIIKQSVNFDNKIILKYFNVKNLSMIKNRCFRIYNIITYMNHNNIKNITSSMRSIFHIKNNTFRQFLVNNVFFK
jgi:hypothetical protein